MYNIKKLHTILKKFCKENGFLIIATLQKCGIKKPTRYKAIKTNKINEQKLQILCAFIGISTKEIKQ